MNEDEKVCPYCGGVIKKVAIKCKHCKALLNKEQSNNTNTNKKKTAIVISIILICIGIGVVGCKAYMDYISDPTYKTIVKHEDIDYWKCSDTSINIANKVIEQTNEMIELMQSRIPQAKKENVFNVYLDNIEYYELSLSNKITVNGDFKGLEFGKNMEIKKPKLPMYASNYYFESYDGEENWGFSLSINYKYLNETFGNYLNKDWQEYLNIKQSHYEEWKAINQNYNKYNHEQGLKKDFDNVILTEAFHKKYPKFERINDIDPLEYTKSVIMTCFRGKVSKNIIIETFEDYFKRADIDTASYKYLQEAYNIMKNNDFEPYDYSLFDISIMEGMQDTVD
jgi:predicted nucleic acid-binding Zn ribbon protein